MICCALRNCSLDDKKLFFMICFRSLDDKKLQIVGITLSPFREIIFFFFIKIQSFASDGVDCPTQIDFFFLI